MQHIMEPSLFPVTDREGQRLALERLREAVAQLRDEREYQQLWSEYRELMEELHHLWVVPVDRQAAGA